MEECNRMCFELAKYRANYAYPPIAVTAPNRRYAAILHNNFAGQSGEITAILQYMYQSISPEAISANIATALHYIGIVEMHHMEMLGGLIFLLGGDAVYTGISHGQPTSWNAGMVSYVRNTKQLLRRDIQDEKTAIEGYRRSISFIADPLIVEVLKRIILDEEFHITILENLLQQMPCNKKTLPQ